MFPAAVQRDQVFLLRHRELRPPPPNLTDSQREQIIEAGQKILEARALHPDRSLAEHYNPLAMDPVLLKAHDKLDRAVDKAFRATRKLST